MIKISSLLFLFIPIFNSFSYCQNFQDNRIIDSVYFAENIKTLQPSKMKLLNIPAAYELPILISISYFQDLACKKIIFKECKINTTFNARPKFTSLLFSNKQNRTYIIRINTRIKDSIISLSSIPFNALIGVFAHELSHLSDYQNHSFFGVIGRGLAYATKNSKASYEKEIDKKTIYRGLGWQLYDWSDFVLNKSNATESYKEFKQEIYLTPDEILSILQLLPSE